MEFDMDGAQAIATRQRIMDMAATDRLRITGMHLDFPGFGHVGARRCSLRVCPGGLVGDLLSTQRWASNRNGVVPAIAPPGALANGTTTDGAVSVAVSPMCCKASPPVPLRPM
jgi:hypothetical protein